VGEEYLGDHPSQEDCQSFEAISGLIYRDGEANEEAKL